MRSALKKLFPRPANTELTRLAVTSGLSTVGGTMCALAFAYLAFKQTGSAFSAVLVSVAYTVAYALSAVPGAAAVKKMDRRRVVVGFDAIKIVNYSIVLALQAMGQLEVWMVVAASAVGGLTSGPQYPAWQQILQTLSPKGTLDQTDGLFSSVSSVGAVAGALLGGVLLDAFGAVAPFSINVVSYLPFMVAVFLLPARAGTSTDSRKSTKSVSLKKVLDSMRKSRLIAFGLTLTVLLNLFAWPIVALLPRVASEFGASAHVYGILLGAFYLGGILVAGAVAGWKRVFTYGQIMRRSLTACGASLLLLAIMGFAPWGSTLSTASAALLLATLGVVLGVTGSILGAIVQLSAEKKAQGTVLAVYAVIGLGAGSLGGLAEGFVADRLEIWWLPLASGALILLAMSWMWEREEYKELDQADPDS
ncbi:MAG: MFS transporter, partial [bacterium]